MTVWLTTRTHAGLDSEAYSDVVRLTSDGKHLRITFPAGMFMKLLKEVAEIELDDEPMDVMGERYAAYVRGE